MIAAGTKVDAENINSLSYEVNHFTQLVDLDRGRCSAAPSRHYAAPSTSRAAATFPGTPLSSKRESTRHDAEAKHRLHTASTSSNDPSREGLDQVTTPGLILRSNETEHAARRNPESLPPVKRRSSRRENTELNCSRVIPAQLRFEVVPHSTLILGVIAAGGDTYPHGVCGVDDAQGSESRGHSPDLGQLA